MSKVLIFGDLHFDDRYRSSHIDYPSHAIKILDEVDAIIAKEMPDYIFLLGDVIGGTRSKVLAERSSLAYLMTRLVAWNHLTNRRVFSVVGNHDLGGGTTDFEVLTSSGLIQTANYIDVDGLLRVHLLNYGELGRKVELGDEMYNLCLAHDNIKVGTELCPLPNRHIMYELSEMKNLAGVDLVIGGHIHDPSDRIVNCQIDGTDVGMFYLGAPIRGTRSATYSSVYYGKIEVDVEEQGVDLNLVTMPLCPLDEEHSDKVLEEVDEDDLDKVDLEALSEVLSEIASYNIVSLGDLYGQIDVFCGKDEPVRQKVQAYIESASS